MKMKFFITKLIQCKDYDEYMEVRITIPDGILKVMEITGGFNWDLIKDYEAKWQDFIKWFSNVEVQ